MCTQTPAEAIEVLRRAGLRLSTARRIVIEALFAADRPVSASELAARLVLEESSVYRNLEVLERHGLVRHIHLGHGPGLYALAANDDTEYLYCERCERATPLTAHELDGVRELIRARFGHTPDFSHFAIVGRCADCAALDSAAVRR